MIFVLLNSMLVDLLYAPPLSLLTLLFYFLCRFSPQNDGKTAIDLAKSEVSSDYISLVYSISLVCHNWVGPSTFLIVLTIIV